MPNKKDQIEDEFDDLDFEDLDSEESFGDDSWDEFDDAEEDSGDAIDAVADGDSESKGAPSGHAKKKSFLQKNFNLIVIALAVLGGGGFIFSQMGGQLNFSSFTNQAGLDIEMQQAGTLEQIPEEIPELAGDLPPMPAPIENLENEEFALSNSVEDSIASDLDFELEPSSPQAEPKQVESTSQLESDAILTPLPDLTATPDTELADLDALTQENPAKGEDAKGGDFTDLTVSEDDVVSALEGRPVQENSAFKTPDAEINADISLETANLKAQIKDLNQTLSSNQAALDLAQETENKLSKDLQAANMKIQDLNIELEALQKQLNILKNNEKLSSSAKNAPAEVEKSAPSPKKRAQEPQEKVKTAKIVPSSDDNKTELSPSETTKILEWVLKSAGPGRATLSPKDSSDMRQVEVGDVVPGLGRIQSISIEDNRWIVRGEKSSVSQ
ncbi:MAG TPA: hypothetical protein PK513_03160 [Alphaproteobacteria bacterium]|nr:hypothetical protein [Leptospiraceae bacterium]MCB1581290.1 hypothetical protein [Alphaproteobacteria bacterium]USO05164.1 MAG: hypothetical protein H6859_08400 [Rhodospirillales bacterium]HOO81485.1 hypothetical protein [Alphaproteobacteria bacterium]